ncbi:Regulator of hemoglobinization and erythroid cell expansion protein [Camelus dromedarius]|uniref:Regulator of hemoglobinization and erythroid cell expansion protein n=1 Tax=Camelus dromedarius TaxID=9838 RepID=A0A5N4CJC7_CAMDR|nr:Regulator of hemoglobinization and erythroid cell expansion protein [Camelus dromedarius]
MVGDVGSETEIWREESKRPLSSLLQVSRTAHWEHDVKTRYPGGSTHIPSGCLRERLSRTHNPQLPCEELMMLTEEMKLWHGVVMAAVSLILQACLLAAINYLLSRHIVKENERILKRARLQISSSAHHHPPAAKEVKETGAKISTPVSEPCYQVGEICLSGFLGTEINKASARKKNSFYFSLDDSDTSSNSSDSSDSSDSSPPTHQATKDVNYTQVVFSAPGGRRNDSALDYENIKETTDYVNVNPKSHKPNFWTFVNPAVSEPVEYTQVAV